MSRLMKYQIHVMQPRLADLVTAEIHANEIYSPKEKRYENHDIEQELRLADSWTTVKKKTPHGDAPASGVARRGGGMQLVLFGNEILQPLAKYQATDRALIFVTGMAGCLFMAAFWAALVHDEEVYAVALRIYSALERWNPSAPTLDALDASAA